MRPSRVCLVLVLLLSSCARREYTRGQADPARIDRGEVFVERIMLSASRHMVKATGVIDVPPWQVWNAVSDVAGYALWNPMVRSARVLKESSDGGEVIWDMDLEPAGALAPITLHYRVDEQRRQITFTAYENAWVRAFQCVYSVEPHGDGGKTLFTVYDVADIKGPLAHFAGHEHESGGGRLVAGLREGARLPQYTRPPEKQRPLNERTRVVILEFQSSGVGKELPVTAGQVFAEQLMRGGRYNIITQDEMVALLEHSRQRALAGCDGAGDCMADIGKTLDAQALLQGTIARLGDRTIFTASLISMPDGNVRQRVSEEATSDEELLERIRRAADGFTDSRDAL